MDTEVNSMSPTLRILTDTHERVQKHLLRPENSDYSLAQLSDAYLCLPDYRLHSQAVPPIVGDVVTLHRDSVVHYAGVETRAYAHDLHNVPLHVEEIARHEQQVVSYELTGVDREGKDIACTCWERHAFCVVLRPTLTYADVTCWYGHRLVLDEQHEQPARVRHLQTALDLPVLPPLAIAHSQTLLREYGSNLLDVIQYRPEEDNSRDLATFCAGTHFAPATPLPRPLLLVRTVQGVYEVPLCL